MIIFPKQRLAKGLLFNLSFHLGDIHSLLEPQGLGIFLGMQMNKNTELFNRFEWNKTVAKNPEELKEKFPIKNLIGKKIKKMNAIGFVHHPYTEYIPSGDVNKKFFQEKETYHAIVQNEPFVFVFEDNSTFELQLMWENKYFFTLTAIYFDFLRFLGAILLIMRMRRE